MFLSFPISILLILGVALIPFLWIVHVHRKLMINAQQITDIEKMAAMRAEVYKTTSQLVGGFAVIAGLFITTNQFFDSRSQFQQTIKHQEEQLHQSRQSNSLQRFETAIAGLESKDASRRTSGVLTINIIAKEFPESYGTIADDVLIAFVRDGLSSVIHSGIYKNGGIWPPRDKRLAIELLSDRLDRNAKAVTKLSDLDLTRSDLSNLRASGLNLSGSNFDNANLSKSSFVGAVLNQSKLSNSSFFGAMLTDAELKNITAKEANFTAATLNGAVFDGSDLRGSRFTIAAMVNASFKGANLAGSSFAGAILKNTDLRGANLIGIELLSQAQLNEAKGDDTTTLPSTLKKPQNWK